jgi:multimeric flavodoxin WrbA
MKLIIHDLPEEQAKAVIPQGEDIRVIAPKEKIGNCIGCFGCWVKTPGKCVIKDDYSLTGALVGQSEELIILSRCSYGGFSPFVKNVLDRSISYVHPYFVIRHGEMHHRRRYQNSLSLRVFFYGNDIKEREKKTAKSLVAANALNFDCGSYQVEFIEDVKEVEGRL